MVNNNLSNSEMFLVFSICVFLITTKYQKSLENKSLFYV